MNASPKSDAFARFSVVSDPLTKALCRTKYACGTENPIVQMERAGHSDRPSGSSLRCYYFNPCVDLVHEPSTGSPDLQLPWKAAFPNTAIDRLSA